MDPKAIIALNELSVKGETEHADDELVLRFLRTEQRLVNAIAPAHHQPRIDHVGAVGTKLGAVVDGGFVKLVGAVGQAQRIQPREPEGRVGVLHAGLQDQLPVAGADGAAT